MLTEEQLKQMKKLNKNEKILNNSSEEDLKIIQKYIKNNKSNIPFIDMSQIRDFNKGEIKMNEQDQERLNQIKEQYLYFESHKNVDFYEVYDADREDLAADLSFLINLVNKLIKE